MKKLINIFAGFATYTALLLGALTGCTPKSIGDPFVPSHNGNNTVSLYYNGEAMRSLPYWNQRRPFFAEYYSDLDTLVIYSKLRHLPDSHNDSDANLLIIVPSPNNTAIAEKNARLLFLYNYKKTEISDFNLTLDYFEINILRNGHRRSYAAGTFAFSGIKDLFNENAPFEVTNGLFDMELETIQGMRRAKYESWFLGL